jgi:hypothetical protein
MDCILDCATSRKFWGRDPRFSVRRRVNIAQGRVNKGKRSRVHLYLLRATSRDPLPLGEGRAGSRT